LYPVTWSYPRVTGRGWDPATRKMKHGRPAARRRELASLLRHQIAAPTGTVESPRRAISWHRLLRNRTANLYQIGLPPPPLPCRYAPRQRGPALIALWGESTVAKAQQLDNYTETRQTPSYYIPKGYNMDIFATCQCGFTIPLNSLPDALDALDHEIAAIYESDDHTHQTVLTTGRS